MEKKRLQEVAEHIVDLESDIYFRNGSPRQQRQELSVLDSIIEEIQENTEQSHDQAEFSFLSRLQQKAYQCRVRVLKRAVAGVPSHGYQSQGRRSKVGSSV